LPKITGTEKVNRNTPVLEFDWLSRIQQDFPDLLPCHGNLTSRNTCVEKLFVSSEVNRNGRISRPTPGSAGCFLLIRQEIEMYGWLQLPVNSGTPGFVNYTKPQASHSGK